MNLRNVLNVLVVLLILVLLSHFVGVPFAYGGPLSLVILLLIVCVLVGAL